MIYKRCSRCGKKIPQDKQCDCKGIADRERYKEYNKRVRFNKDNIKYADFYNSIAWRRLSRYITQQYNGLCIMCLIEYGEITPYNVVHHIEEIRTGWEERLIDTNLIPLCYRCHNSIHANYTQADKDKLKQILKQYKTLYSI